MAIAGICMLSRDTRKSARTPTTPMPMPTATGLNGTFAASSSPSTSVANIWPCGAIKRSVPRPYASSATYSAHGTTIEPARPPMSCATKPERGGMPHSCSALQSWLRSLAALTATHVPVRTFCSSSTSEKALRPHASNRRQKTRAVMKMVPETGDADVPIWRERTAPSADMRRAIKTKAASMVIVKPSRPSVRRICRPIKQDPAAMATHKSDTTREGRESSSASLLDSSSTMAAPVGLRKRSIAYITAAVIAPPPIQLVESEGQSTAASGSENFISASMYSMIRRMAAPPKMTSAVGSVSREPIPMYTGEKGTWTSKALPAAVSIAKRVTLALASEKYTSRGERSEVRQARRSDTHNAGLLPCGSVAVLISVTHA
mmetsp:Transcript_32400/g.107133  ORF Transcript_32400/g.107133 Transcript_32400/m.107133 type:complete len:375 (-) Transcript_32400:390-1514(-)